MKDAVFLGDSRDRLREFPERARRQLGMELRRVQLGLEPSDWKPMKSAGVGVREIHAFQKKTRATTKRDLQLAALRLALLK